MADEKPAPSTTVLVLLAILGGGSTNLASNVFGSNPRVDPWTGTDAKEAHKKFVTKERVNYLQLRIERLESKHDK